MIPLLGGALLAGLVGSPHCVGMCGAFATAGGGARVPWHLGRLAAYTAAGTAAGALGGAIPFPPAVSAGIGAMLLAWFSLRLAGLAPALPAPAWFPTHTASALFKNPSVLAQLAFGALSALLPCGLLWTALSVAAASGSAFTGGAAMAAFWLGTSPALLTASAGLRALATARPKVRWGLAALVFVAGMWSISTRAGFGAAPSAIEGEDCHTAG